MRRYLFQVLAVTAGTTIGAIVILVSLIVFGTLIGIAERNPGGLIR